MQAYPPCLNIFAAPGKDDEGALEQDRWHMYIESGGALAIAEDGCGHFGPLPTRHTAAAPFPGLVLLSISAEDAHTRLNRAIAQGSEAHSRTSAKNCVRALCLQAIAVEETSYIRNTYHSTYAYFVRASASARHSAVTASSLGTSLTLKSLGIATNALLNAL